MTVRCKRGLILALVCVLVLASAVAVAATVLFSFRVKGNINGDTAGVDGLLSLTADNTALSFSAAGETKDVPLCVKNSTGKNIVYHFGLSAKTALTDENTARLAAAILVFFDGKFAGTLAELTAGGEAAIGQGLVMGKSENTTEMTHTLSFQLHIAAEESLLRQAMEITVTTYAENADYRTVLFVSTEEEFQRAADDINSGLLSGTATVVLGGDLTVSSATELKNPANIDLCGNTLTLNAALTLSGAGAYRLYSSRPAAATTVGGSGGITVDNAGAILDIADFTAADGTNVGALYAAKVSLSAFDGAAAANLLSARFARVLKTGITGGAALDVFGALACYRNFVTIRTEGECTFTGGTLSANAVTATSVGALNVTAGGVTGRYEFRILGGADADVLKALFEGELAHIPDSVLGDAVVSDIFLPRRIEGKNISITWASSDEASISASGRLADTLKENTVVTLYAKIVINEKVYTHSFTFKVTSQTREVKFKYLVSQLSPINLNKVGMENGLFYLPTADGGAQDYRGEFDMYAAEDSTRLWAAFRDIGLADLHYTVHSSYSFVSLTKGGSGVYLNSATFFTFAQMSVTGTFTDGETEEGTVNIIIELGNNSELYDLVFAFVEKKFGAVDILQNILDTRAVYGAKYERGDFYLDAEYQGIGISYAPATKGAGITSITVENGKWHAAVDPTGFATTESSVGIVVTVKKEGDTSGGISRTLYVTAPGVIKPDNVGFANYSVFNSVKYQVTEAVKNEVIDGAAGRVATLPPITVENADSGKKPTGFTVIRGSADVANTLVTNSTPKYILVRDAALAPTLTFRVGNSAGASAAHNKAYLFARLLAWATGKTKTVQPVEVGTYTNVTSDGNEYISENEKAVLIAFLAGINGYDAAKATALLASATTAVKNGHVIDNYDAVAEKVKELITTYSTDTMLYFKYTEVLQWALNEKDFPNAGGGNQYAPPNLGYIGKYDIDMSQNNGTNYTGNALNWSSTPSTWRANPKSSYWNSKYYNYQEDRTEYISDAEAQCLIAFWWGVNESAGRAFATTLLASCVVPTYLHEDGAGILVNAIYEAMGTDAFTVALVDGVPQISILDFSTAGLDHFAALTEIAVYGKLDGENVLLPAFLTESSANGYFNRVTKLDAERTDTRLTRMVMQACSDGYVTLELTNISRLSALTKLDISYNSGVVTLGDLLNLNIQGITLLDVHRVAVYGDYLTYVLENIKVNAKSATIYYTAGGVRKPYTTNAAATSDSLRFLKELTLINSPYLLLPINVNGKKIQWYVEKGNPAYIITGAGNDQITGTVNSAADMDRMLKNYYADTTDQKIYRLVYENGSYAFRETGDRFDEKVTSLPDAGSVDWSNATESEWSNGSEKINDSGWSLPSAASQVNINGGGVTLVERGTPTRQGWFYYTYYFENKLFSFVDRNGTTKDCYFLYSKTETVTKTMTYRYRKGTYAEVSGTYLLNDGSVVTVNYAKTADGKYVDYTVTLSRVYTLYYAYTDSTYYSSSATSSPTNGTLTLIPYQNAELVCRGKTYQNNYDGFYYCNPESDAVTGAACGTQTYTGTDAQTRMESYLGSLSSTSPLWQSESAEPSIAQTTHYSYTTIVNSQADRDSAAEYAATVANGYYLYQFQGGTNNSNTYYVGGNTVTSSYIPYTATNAQGYRLTFDGTNGFVWVSHTIQNDTGDATMEAILKAAQVAKDTVEFGNYYGTYYCFYGGTDSAPDVLVNGKTFTRYSVYRLLTDENGDFYYASGDRLPAEKRTFTVFSSSDELKTALNAAAKEQTGAMAVGSIAYYTGGKDIFYANGMLELTLNTATKVYYFKTMGGIGNISMNITKDSSGNETAASFNITESRGQNLSANGLSKFTNVRYVGTSSTSFYSGTGGSEEVVIVARVLGTDDVRKFKVTVSA